ncbi:MAG: signal peptidase II [Coriobacteriia bacterium]|nr:signal peptidase II [Coriobacteriia bacterium]
MPATNSENRAKRNTVLFCGVALAWFLLDYLTKRWADTANPGALLWSGIPGVLDFRLVHNTGAAWGMFGGSTFALGIFAIAFCIALIVLAMYRRGKAHPAEMFGYAMVLAGGLGNALDRFASSYVVDFIETTFIDFPVFNVADIGVTCGFALIVLFYILLDKDETPTDSATKEH